jgi:predicted rRNA methylase YqxC with S4 and FtsJ domains
VLLEAGAARVYAVDAGHGQLLGSLRQDPRVVVLERTNLGELDPHVVADVVEVVTMHLSYLPVARAAPQLGAVALSQRQSRTPRMALAACGWAVVAATRSPALGARGAVEWLVHARR